jgi:hypothetical protein
LTSEVRESVDATADSARTFADAAARVEYRLAGPGDNEEPVLELALHGETEAELEIESGTDRARDAADSPTDDDAALSHFDEHEPTALSQANKRWR